MAAEGVLSKKTGKPLTVPDVIIPDEYVHLWILYFRLSEQVSRIREGICGKIPPSEIVAYLSLTKTELSVNDFYVLSEIDDAWAEAMNIELAERREAEEREREAKLRNSR